MVNLQKFSIADARKETKTTRNESALCELSNGILVFPEIGFDREIARYMPSKFTTARCLRSRARPAMSPIGTVHVLGHIKSYMKQDT